MSGSVSSTITIPDDVLLMAAVRGQLAELAKAHNWEMFGSQTPEATAAVFEAIVNSLTWS